jgi:putative glycerol-1-phosphate prenyltransferase
MKQSYYQDLQKVVTQGTKCLAILIDPDKFDTTKVNSFLKKIPLETTHLFVGGSTVQNGHTEATVKAIKRKCNLPVFLFPGDYTQITDSADALLFLSLLSGRNAEYLIGQQVRSIAKLKEAALEVISTGYILVNGGQQSAVARVTGTNPISQNDILTIVHTALAGYYLGAKLLYLEAGSGAKIPVHPEVITAVRNVIPIPLLVGGGIRTEVQKQAAYKAGADLVVMGTAFEAE